MKTIYNIIKKPILTEKSKKLQNNYNYITLETSITSNKYNIKNSIYKLFGITPLKINTMNYRGKCKRIGKTKGKRRNFKKALIKLRQKTDINYIKIINDNNIS